MTKRDYALIARVLAKCALSGEMYQPNYLHDEFAKALAAENSKFNREKFLRACWKEPGGGL